MTWCISIFDPLLSSQEIMPGPVRSPEDMMGAGIFKELCQPGAVTTQDYMCAKH